MKTLLVIGGTGFFGKSFLDCFQRGMLDEWGVSKVIVMSRNSERLMIDAPQLISSRVVLVSQDIGRAQNIPWADYVIHAAASTDAMAYIENPDRESKNIESAIKNYCNLAQRFHRKSHILYVSSGAVYGSQPETLKNIPEEFPMGGLDMMDSGKRNYAAAKRIAENEFFSLRQTGLNLSIARCFSFVGPWLPRDQHFAIGNFLEKALRKDEIHVTTTYPVYRSYMHTDDLVRWLMTLCSNANPYCPFYNVGSDEGVSIGGLADIIAEEFGVKVIKNIHLQNKVDRYVPSIEKAKKELELRLSVNLKEAILKTVRILKKEF